MSTILLLFRVKEVNNAELEECPRFVTSLLHVTHLLFFGTLFVLSHMGVVGNSSIYLTHCILVDYPIHFHMTENRKASTQTKPIKWILLFSHIVLNMSEGSV